MHETTPVWPRRASCTSTAPQVSVANPRGPATSPVRIACARFRVDRSQVLHMFMCGFRFRGAHLHLHPHLRRCGDGRRQQGSDSRRVEVDSHVDSLRSGFSTRPHRHSPPRTPAHTLASSFAPLPAPHSPNRPLPPPLPLLLASRHRLAGPLSLPTRGCSSFWSPPRLQLCFHFWAQPPPGGQHGAFAPECLQRLLRELL